MLLRLNLSRIAIGPSPGSAVNMNRTTTLGWIDGSAADERLEINLVQNATGALELVMSEQHFAEGIGWFAQRSISLDSQQVAQLKNLLLANDLPARRRRAAASEPGQVMKLHARPRSDDSEPWAEVG